MVNFVISLSQAFNKYREVLRDLIARKWRQSVISARQKSQKTFGLTYWQTFVSPHRTTSCSLFCKFQSRKSSFKSVGIQICATVHMSLCLAHMILTRWCILYFHHVVLVLIRNHFRMTLWSSGSEAWWCVLTSVWEFHWKDAACLCSDCASGESI